jgi:hypothetical protein
MLMRSVRELLASWPYFLRFAVLGWLGSANAKAAILFDGEWENFAPFYNVAGWTHGKDSVNPSGPADRGADTGLWADYVSFFGVNNPWLQVHAKSPTRITLVQDPISPKGRLVARFEVRPGDYTVSGDRAELVYMWKDSSRFPVTAASGHEFYGISVKVAPDWRAPGDDLRYRGTKWGVFMQLHSPDIFSAPPAVALSATNDFHLSMDSGDLLNGGTRNRNNDVVDIPFSNGALERGHWVQFVIDVTWALDRRGAIAVYRRDEGQTAFVKVLDRPNIPTLTSKYGIDPGKNEHYWAVGFYRSRNADLTNVLWLGPIVRGTMFDEVAKTAFGRP